MDSIAEKIKYLKEFVKENANFDAFDSELLSLLEAVAREQIKMDATCFERHDVELRDTSQEILCNKPVTNTLKELL